MKKISIVLLIAGVVSIVAGKLFLHSGGDAVDSKAMTVTTGGSKSFDWPIDAGGICLAIGGILYAATHLKNGKVQHN